MEDMSAFPLELTGSDAPMVSFKKVRKAYGALVVLDNLELDVAAGEMVTIIGPSGSGKTTVLRMLMTLEQINGGVIYVDGQPLTHMPKGGQLVTASPRRGERMLAGQFASRSAAIANRSGLRLMKLSSLKFYGISLRRRGQYDQALRILSETKREAERRGYQNLARGLSEEIALIV